MSVDNKEVCALTVRFTAAEVGAVRLVTQRAEREVALQQQRQLAYAIFLIYTLLSTCLITLGSTVRNHILKCMYRIYYSLVI